MSVRMYVRMYVCMYAPRTGNNGRLFWPTGSKFLSCTQLHPLHIYTGFQNREVTGSSPSAFFRFIIGSYPGQSPSRSERFHGDTSHCSMEEALRSYCLLDSYWCFKKWNRQGGGGWISEKTVTLTL
jgi:hypothetical protein